MGSSSLTDIKPRPNALGAGSLSHSTTREVLQGASLKVNLRDFPGGTADKNLPADAGDTGSIPGPGRFHMLRSN